MTAPDVNADVCARFEAHHGITWAAIQSLPIGSGSRLHLESHYKRHLDTWQAALPNANGKEWCQHEWEQVTTSGGVMDRCSACGKHKWHDGRGAQ